MYHILSYIIPLLTTANVDHINDKDRQINKVTLAMLMWPLQSGTSISLVNKLKVDIHPIYISCGYLVYARRIGLS